MKKFLLLLSLILLSFALIAQERELSDYEKYRMAQEQEMLAPIDTTKVDTVYIVLEQEAEPVVINNYYSDYNQPNYRDLFTFGYVYRPYYSYYNYYDPFYYDWYSPYYYGHYYGHSYYPYYGYNNYYGHNYYNYGHYSQPRGQRYATSNALGRNNNYYRPYNKTYSSGYVNPPTTTKKNIVATRPQEKPTYNKSNRSYTPTYSNPRMATRPSYNNSATKRVTTTTRPESRSVQQSTQSRSTYTRPSSSTVTRTPASTQSRTYSAPSRSYNAPSRAPSTAPSRSYSTPSRSTQSYSAPRSSSSSGRSSSSGSATRSSSGGRR